MELSLLDRNRLLATVGRGPRRERCREVVEAFFAGTELSSWPEPSILGAFQAEGLACAAVLQGRELPGPPERLAPFVRVGEGIADAVSGRLRPGDDWQNGHGFGAAMFRPGRTLDRAVAPPGATPAFDSGVGRAIWFRSAGDLAQARRVIERFPEVRRAALFHGLGFALAFAGEGADAGPQTATGAEDGAALRRALVLVVPGTSVG